MSNTEERYVSPSEINPNPGDWKSFYSSINDKERGAFDKYREQYRRGKERAWPHLPQCLYHNGKLVLNDGSHRYRAALAEGASKVLCEIDLRGAPGYSTKKEKPIRDERIKAPGDSLGVLITTRGIYEPGVGNYTPGQARSRAAKLRQQGKENEARSLEMAADKVDNATKSLRAKYKRVDNEQDPKDS